MSDHITTPAPQTEEPPRSRRGLRFTGFVVLVVAAGLTGALASTAFSQGMGFGMGFGPGRWHGGIMSSPFDPAQATDRADRMVRHLAVELDATNEQQDKLRGIVKSTVADVLPMREKVQSARERGRKLLIEPTINRAEIEKLRVEQVALADTFSKRVAQALGDAAEVLTPEQRRKLDERLPPVGAMQHGMGMGPMGGPGRGWNRW